MRFSGKMKRANALKTNRVKRRGKGEETSKNFKEKRRGKSQERRGHCPFVGEDSQEDASSKTKAESGRVGYNVQEPRVREIATHKKACRRVTPARDRGGGGGNRPRKPNRKNGVLNTWREGVRTRNGGRKPTAKLPRVAENERATDGSREKKRLRRPSGGLSRKAALREKTSREKARAREIWGETPHLPERSRCKESPSGWPKIEIFPKERQTGTWGIRRGDG